MKYTFHTDTDPVEFDSFVQQSDQNNLFQCSTWSKVKNGWTSFRTSVREDGKIVATALVLKRKLILNSYLLYIPRGPIMDYNNKELVRFTFSALKDFARRNHACDLRFDPCIRTRVYPYKMRDQRPQEQNLDLVEEIKSMGITHKGFTTMIQEASQPRYNACMTVCPDYMQKLEHKTAKCIRAAGRKGLQVLEGPQYVDLFAQAMHYTEVRKKVALRNESYFRNMLEAYGEKSICMVTVLNFKKQLGVLEERIEKNKKMLEEPSTTKKQRVSLNQELAQDEKEYARLKEDYAREGKKSVITCGILAAYNDKLMELFYMGNNPDYLRMYSSYYLYSLCLDRCVQLGIEDCSFGGIEGTLDDGLTLFKSNFLMDVEEYIGEFNMVLNPVVYGLFDKVYPWALKSAASLRGKK